MRSLPSRAARTFTAVCTLTAALVALPRLTAEPTDDLGWTSPQQLPSREVGDVTRDGRIRASDALAILVDIVGKELPAHFILDPDGDAACRTNVTRIDDDGRHIHAMGGEPLITAADALVILAAVVGRDVSETCLGYDPDPAYEVIWDPAWGTAEDYRTVPIVTVEGITQWERVSVCDTLSQPVACEWPVPPWEGYATQALMRFGTSDPSVASVDTLYEWSSAVGAEIVPKGIGEVDLYARWFDREDTLRFVVYAWDPTFITMRVRTIQRFGQPLNSQLVVGDTSRAWARARGTLGFSKGLGSDSVDFSSSDPGVLTIDATGHITAVAPGSADVTAMWSSFSVSRTLWVLSNSEAVEADLQAAYLSWWRTNHRANPGMALSVAADQHTSSWATTE